MELTFIEMFCGIGGFRLGLERNGWKCVWANDNDKYACQVYRKNFGNKELVEGDIRAVDTRTIPDHDLLTAGFPCQSFSFAGKRKGFEDTRGTLFYEVARIADAKRPPVLLLENVKGLLSNDKGRAFATILQTLDGLGYDVEWQVLNSKHFGVPQNRERVFIVGHLRAKPSRQIFPIGENRKMDIREKEPKISLFHNSGAEIQRIYDPDGVAPSLHVKTGGWQEPKIVADRTRSYANLGRNLESPKPITNALSGVQKDNLVLQLVGDRDNPSLSIKKGEVFCLPSNPMSDRQQMVMLSHSFDGGKSKAIILGNIWEKNQNDGKVLSPEGLSLSLHGQGHPWVEPKISDGVKIRRLTPVECERLQGFPDGWTGGVSDTQRYKLLGNAVTVNVIEYLGARLLGCVQ
jgi:DNA (cytosine-5)-methyltransferase 1